MVTSQVPKFLSEDDLLRHEVCSISLRTICIVLVLVHSCLQSSFPPSLDHELKVLRCFELLEDRVRVLFLEEVLRDEVDEPFVSVLLSIALDKILVQGSVVGSALCIDLRVNVVPRFWDATVLEEVDDVEVKVCDLLSIEGLEGFELTTVARSSVYADQLAYVFLPQF